MQRFSKIDFRANRRRVSAKFFEPTKVNSMSAPEGSVIFLAKDKSILLAAVLVTISELVVFPIVIWILVRYVGTWECYSDCEINFDRFRLSRGQRRAKKFMLP